MKTILTILCLLFCFVSISIAADKDFTGADGLLWQQHVSSTKAVFVKFDEMRLSDGTLIDICYKQNNPTLKELRGIKSMSYLFKNDRFIGVIYELKTELEMTAFVAALMEAIGDPTKVYDFKEGDELDNAKLLWVRPISTVFAVMKTRSVLLGEREAMKEIIKKFGDRKNI